MARKGENKKRCEKYRLSGHLDSNKRLRAKRHEKRMARFAKRKEEGKTYTYNRAKTNEKINEVFGNGFTEKKFCQENRAEISRELFTSNRDSGKAKHTHYAKYTSAMRKLQNWIDAEKNAEKLRKIQLSNK